MNRDSGGRLYDALIGHVAHGVRAEAGPDPERAVGMLGRRYGHDEALLGDLKAALATAAD